MHKPARPSIAIAFAVASLGIAFFSAMDAVMKGLSLEMGAYNALLWRTLAGSVIAGAIYLVMRNPWPTRPAMRFHLIRGTMSSVMAMLFFWGLARIPMAQAIALSFVAPLVALYLAALVLGEKIERSAILASLLGFCGVLVILAGQAEANLGPEAFQGAIAILASAAFYAYNIILMRQQAQVAGPVEIAFFTSSIMSGGFLLAAPLLGVLPTAGQAPGLIGAAVLAFLSLLLLSWAYARAEAQHLAPVEYTGFVWAAFFGFLIFGEALRPLTLIGAAMIVAACLVATRRRPAPVPNLEGAV